jgi:hypothetical protein
MQQDKELSNFIKAMKRNLQKQFGVTVPHSALRASYLLALGENPHAYAGKQDVTLQTSTLMAYVFFEWVYLDEDGDGEDAMLDLNSGKLFGLNVPSDVVAYADDVRTRILVGSDEEMFTAFYRRSSSVSGDWYVDESDLPAIREALMPGVTQFVSDEQNIESWVSRELEVIQSRYIQHGQDQ